MPDGFANCLGEQAHALYNELQDYVKMTLTQVIAAIVNLTAEAPLSPGPEPFPKDRKPGSVPLNCQYASYEAK